MTMYFCYDYRTVSGRPKMEDYLMEIARESALYRTFTEQGRAKLLTDLMEAQERLLAENKRLRPVEVICKNGYDGLVWLDIGEQSLSFRKVKGAYGD